MRILPHLLAVACLAFAGMACAQPVPYYAPGSPAAPDFHAEKEFFSLEHRAPGEMDSADASILQARQGEIAQAAQFYGYDLTAGGWSYEQTVCPQLPDYLMLHYTNTQPDGAISLLTALVPRTTGRVRIVPVYYRSATPFHPAVKNSRNFALFNELVPADVAKAATNPGGAWLSLGACYAEMVGGRPVIPTQPTRDPEMLLASTPILFVSTISNTRQIRFSDRNAARQQYTTWSLSLNNQGRIVGADSEEHAQQVTIVSSLPAPEGKVTQPASVPGSTFPRPNPVPEANLPPAKQIPPQTVPQ